ncbi:MAG: hypothetical protein AAF503_03130 [Pseudomonadota bacterium]
MVNFLKWLFAALGGSAAFTFLLPQFAIFGFLWGSHVCVNVGANPRVLAEGRGTFRIKLQQSTDEKPLSLFEVSNGETKEIGTLKGIGKSEIVSLEDGAHVIRGGFGSGNGAILRTRFAMITFLTLPYTWPNCVYSQERDTAL